MKKFGKSLLLSVAAFGTFAGVASADTSTQSSSAASIKVAEVKPTNSTKSITVQNPTSYLRVGWSFSFASGQVFVASGAGVVGVEGRNVIGLKPGSAVVYNFAADGTVYVNPVEVRP